MAPPIPQGGEPQEHLGDAEVVLHIGAPKTGSSAIQRSCRANRRALRRQGFYYPDHPIDDNGVSGGHSFLVNALKRGDEEGARAQFQASLEKARRRGCRLVLSSETLYRQCEAVMQVIGDVPVAVIAFFRDPVEALVSGYHQQVKRHFMTDRLRAFARRQLGKDGHHLHGHQLYRWADAVGDTRCTFLGYDAERYRTYPIQQDFLAALGIGGRAARSFRIDHDWVNVRYAADALELKRLLNSVLRPEDHALNRRIDAVLQAYSEHDAQVPSGHKLDARTEAGLAAAFADSSRALAERFPGLEPVLRKDRSVQHRGHHDAIARTEVGVALDALVTREPDLEGEVVRRVRKALERGERGPALNKLAEVLGFAVDDPVDIEQILPDARLERILADDNSGADYLREIAVMLETAQDFERAARVIEKARVLRPGGGGIQQIQQRIERKRALLGDDGVSEK